jgi:hypothetical protein
MKPHVIKGIAILLFGVAAFALLMAYRPTLTDPTQRTICSAIAASILAVAVVVGKRTMRSQKK